MSGTSVTDSPSSGIRFVDAHHHFQDLDANYYPWLSDLKVPWKLEGDLAPIRRNYFIGDYLTDLTGVRLTKSVHVQNGWDADDPVGETRWLQGLADHSGFPHAIVAYADLAHPGAGSVLEEHHRYTNVRGIREILNWSENPVLNVARRSDLMADAKWRRGFALLKKFGFSFDLQIYWWQMEDAFDLACAFPETPMILNHFGMPIDRSAEGVAAWSRAMRRLAQAENIFVKLSGFGLGRRDWTTEDTGPLLLRTLEIFGTDRCMCGSNLPFDSLYAPPSRIVEGLLWLSAQLGPEATKVMQTNAEAIYRI